MLKTICKFSLNYNAKYYSASTQKKKIKNWIRDEMGVQKIDKKTDIILFFKRKE